MKFLAILCVAFVLTLSVSGVRAQSYWKVTHSDVWASMPDYVDSIICFTSVSCKGNVCTASGLVISDPVTGGYKRLTMFRSNDGGNTWNEQLFNAPYPLWLTNQGFHKVQQIDSLHAVAIADDGYVVRTSDAGNTWVQLQYPVHRELSDIDFSDSLTGIVIGIGLDSEVFTTSDGGTTWTDRTPPGTYQLGTCRSLGNGRFRFLQYGHGTIYRTNDNFQSVDTLPSVFDSISDPTYHNTIEHCTFSSGDTILAYGRDWPADTNDLSGGYGLIVRSVDDGNTWEKPFIYPTIKINDIRMTTALDRDTIYAAGFSNYHILKSIDRGATWECDTLIFDTGYMPFSCWGITMAPDGHPIGSFGYLIFPRSSVLVRGVDHLAKVDIVEKIQYYTYIYPNPASTLVKISSIDHSAPYRLIDVLGNEVRRGVLSAEGAASINVSSLSSGVYELILDYYDLTFCAGNVMVLKQ